MRHSDKLKMGLRQTFALSHAVRSSRTGMRAPTLTGLFLCVALIIGVGTIGTAAQSQKQKDEYVGSKACAQCHKDIYNKYIQTSMGRSMAEITPSLMQSLHIPATYYDQKLNRHFDVFAKNEKLYQSEFETDAEGKEVFRDTHQMKWVIGAGANGIGLITDRDNYLFQAPLSLYTKPMSWGSSPGYEFADLGFSRPILSG